MYNTEVRIPGLLDFSGNSAKNWRKFFQDIEVYLVSTEKEGKRDHVKVVLMLMCSERSVLDICDTLR